ncbi:MAG: xylulokinase [Planctomycetes bacterium]|nr:xylulokinase [Planctomycetota bacterium]
MAGGLFLGLDCGTQGLKALLLDGATGAVVALARRSYKTLPAAAPGVSEQDPRVWIAAAKSAIREIVTSIGRKRAAGIAAIAVSGQQHGMVALDGAGRVLRPAKLWNDTSTSAEAAEIIELCGGANVMIRSAGNAPPPGFTASKVLWMQKHEPRIYERCAAVLLPHEYINFWLTGEMAAEAGDASGTGWFNIYNRGYAKNILKAVAPDLFNKIPPVVAAGSAVGTLRAAIARELLLQAGTLVGHGGGDNMMAAIGTGAVREGIITVSLGTSGTAFAYSKKPVADPRGEIAGFCDSTGGWLPLMCIQNCTNVTEAVKRVLSVDNIQLEKLAARAPAGADGMLLLPFLGGERTPNLPGARGSIVGLDHNNFTRESLARAAMEAPTLGLAFGIARLRELGVRASEVRLTGGGSRSAFWRRLCADAFDLPVVNLAEDEGAALGAAICAAWCAARTEGARISADAMAARFVKLRSSSRIQPHASTARNYRSIARDRARWIDKIYK